MVIASVLVIGIGAWWLQRSVFAMTPADACRKVAATCFRDMTCHAYGEHSFAVPSDQYRYFNVDVTGAYLEGMFEEYDGGPLQGLDCVDSKRRIVLRIEAVPLSPVTADAAGDLCRALGRM